MANQFERFQQLWKKKLTPLLIDVLENVVSPIIPANQKHLLLKSFVKSSNGVNEWHSNTITHDSWHKLIDSLKNHGLIGGEIMAEQPFTSDMASYDYIWHYLDIVGLTTIKTYKELNTYEESKTGANRPKLYKGSDGAFFAYWNTAHQIDLSRYQVLNHNDLFFNQQIHKIPCVFYAIFLLAEEGVIDYGRNESPDHFMGRLKQVQVQFSRRNDKQEMEWTNNSYNMKHLDYACQSLSIHCKVHYFDEESLNKEIRTRDV